MLMASQVFLIVFTTVALVLLTQIIIGVYLFRREEKNMVDPTVYFDANIRDFLDGMIGTELAAMLMPQITDKDSQLSWGHYRNLLEELYPNWFTEKGPNRVTLCDFWIDGFEYIYRTQDNPKLVYMLGNHHFWVCHCIQHHADKKFFLSIDVYDIVLAVSNILRIAKEREDCANGIRNTRYDAAMMRAFKNGEKVIEKINNLHAKYNRRR